MRNFLSTTAVALTMTTAAYADGHTAVFSDAQFDPAMNINATEIVGMRVYASEASIENNMTIAADGETEWDDIGEINEILLTRDGDVQSVIVGVGGFLGIGEKDVAINMSELRFVNEEGETDDFFLVVEATTVGVQDAPAYEYSQLTNSMGDGDEMGAWTGPDIEMDGFARMMPEDLTTEDLTGAPVFGVNDEEVGEIGELLVTDNGKLDRAVIDVGGILGLGEREVAVSLDELTILRMDDGDDVRVYIDASQEALEQQPEYDG
ncbi:PRC-barrel domain protein [Yoonia maricola]|uniref:PRC-barrel domain protein n=1 Tax=Yoonia maricola TaxID=420999 RepID=A0A2M8W0P7_9RHOB|nr:PRC-barrel domain-containing protein [Yoonia maricola]PJI84493.1 PRC-barrel domain protein [Yoonia maricola]